MSVSDSQRKSQLTLLGVLTLVAVGLAGYEMFKRHKAREAEREAAAQALELRFQPSSRVREFLNRFDAPPPRSDGEFPCVFASEMENEKTPRLGKCEVPATHSGPVERFEADLRYGQFILRQSDLYVNDVFDVPLTRSYNSGDFISPNHVHAFGKNTNHPYDIAPLGTRNPYTYNLIALEDGEFLFFDRVSDGVGYADAIFQHTETSTRFYKAVTAWNGSGWTTFLADGSKILFPESYHAISVAQGAPTERRDPQGNSLKLLRDDQRNLVEIRTPNKRFIRLNHDDQGRIIRAQDDQGNWAEYRYNENGMLTNVTYSSGRQRYYSYQDALMTEIEDENRKMLLRNSYRGGVLTKQDFGNGQVYSYAYTPSSTGGPYAESVEVTLPDGTSVSVGCADSVPGFIKTSPN